MKRIISVNDMIILFGARWYTQVGGAYLSGRQDFSCCQVSLTLFVLTTPIPEKIIRPTTGVSGGAEQDTNNLGKTNCFQTGNCGDARKSRPVHLVLGGLCAIDAALFANPLETH